MAYFDFEVEVRSTKGGLTEVRVLSSPCGSTDQAETFSLPWSTAEQLRLVMNVERRIRGAGIPKSRGGERVLSPKQAGGTTEELGRALFEALFQGAVRRKLFDCQAWVHGKLDHLERLGILLRITFNGAPFARLPWELIHDGTDYLCRQRQTPVVRSFARHGFIRPIPERPLRVLLIGSRPRGLVDLDIEEEVKAVAEALRSTRCDVKLLLHPTWEAARAALLDGGYHILHFIGHGGRSRSASGPVLYLENADGGPEPVSGRALYSLISGVASLRLVFLNSCWSGSFPRWRGQDPFTGVASTLVELGLPAAVAMQFPVSDQAAITFSKSVYRRLAAGDALGAAVTEGRIEMVHDECVSLEWIIPVLYLAGSDHLFDLRLGDEGEAANLPEEWVALGILFRLVPSAGPVKLKESVYLAVRPLSAEDWTRVMGRAVEETPDSPESGTRRELSLDDIEGFLDRAQAGFARERKGWTIDFPWSEEWEAAEVLSRKENASASFERFYGDVRQCCAVSSGELPFELRGGPSTQPVGIQLSTFRYQNLGFRPALRGPGARGNGLAKRGD